MSKTRWPLQSQKFSQQGFTIVELLIVVVVISILATMSIVTYNGVTARANTASAQSGARDITKKAEVYKALENRYPDQPAALTSSEPSDPYYLEGFTFDETALSTSNLPTAPSEVNFYRCGTSSVGSVSDSWNMTIFTGVRIDYWDYSSNTAKSITTGQTSGNSSAGYTINCFIYNLPPP